MRTINEALRGAMNRTSVVMLVSIVQDGDKYALLCGDKLGKLRFSSVSEARWFIHRNPHCKLDPTSSVKEYRHE